MSSYPHYRRRRKEEGKGGREGGLDVRAQERRSMRSKEEGWEIISLAFNGRACAGSLPPPGLTDGITAADLSIIVFVYLHATRPRKIVSFSGF